MDSFYQFIVVVFVRRNDWGTLPSHYFCFSLFSPQGKVKLNILVTVFLSRFDIFSLRHAPRNTSQAEQQLSLGNALFFFIKKKSLELMNFLLASTCFSASSTSLPLAGQLLGEQCFLIDSLGFQIPVISSDTRWMTFETKRFGDNYFACHEVIDMPNHVN